MRILRLAVLLAATGAALAGCASVLPKLEAPQLAVTSVVIGGGAAIRATAIARQRNRSNARGMLPS